MKSERLGVEVCPNCLNRPNYKGEGYTYGIEPGRVDKVEYYKCKFCGVSYGIEVRNMKELSNMERKALINTLGIAQKRIDELSIGTEEETPVGKALCDSKLSIDVARKVLFREFGINI